MENRIKEQMCLFADRLGPGNRRFHGDLRSAWSGALEYHAPARPHLGTQFFNPAVGGDVLLFQHLFWWFGHPEVYLIFIPGSAVVSTIVTNFSRRHLFGYLAMVLALVSIGFMAFGLWVHHMFATGIPQIAASYFTVASMMIAIPSGVQIFCWLATMATGKVVLRAPMWWAIGFFFVFIMGGMTGIFAASVPVDLQVHDTCFVVAHFHYVLMGERCFRSSARSITGFRK